MIGHRVRFAKSQKAFIGFTDFMHAQRHRVEQHLDAVEHRIDKARAAKHSGPLLRYGGNTDGYTSDGVGGTEGWTLQCAGDELVFETYR